MSTPKQAENTEKKEKLVAFKSRLQGWCAERGIRQADIAKALGLEPPAVGHWWKGKNFPGPSARIRLARFLKVQPEWLYEGKTEYKLNEVEPPTLNEPRTPYPAMPEGDRVNSRTPFASPTAQPTAEQCLQHLAEYLNAAQQVPGGIGHTWLELQEHFPLHKFKKHQTPDKK